MLTSTELTLITPNVVRKFRQRGLLS